MDETYIKVKGKWMHVYRAIDKQGKTLEFMPSQRRDQAAGRLFFPVCNRDKQPAIKNCNRQKRSQQRIEESGNSAILKCVGKIQKTGI